MEDLLGFEVEFIQEDIPVGSPHARGKLVKIDQFGVLLEKHSGKRLAIPWQAFTQGGFIREK